MTIHKEGRWYCFAATIIYVFIAILLSQLFLPNLAWLFWVFMFGFGLLWFWVFWFFRIPARNFTYNESKAICPCDGKVVVIEETFESEYFKDKRLQVSIFMNPLNVHVNLYPITGTVEYVQYHKGKYLVAWHPKSSTENERSTVVIKNNSTEILVRQIAGAVARRIVTYSQKGDSAKQNGELGFIKFGSRVDLYFPLGTQIDVKIDDIVKGGIHSIAHLA